MRTEEVQVHCNQGYVFHQLILCDCMPLQLREILKSHDKCQEKKSVCIAKKSAE